MFPFSNLLRQVADRRLPVWQTAIRWHKGKGVKYEVKFSHHVRKFTVDKQLKTYGITKRLSTPDGRRLLMRSLLADSKFLAYGHRSREKDDRLNYPL